MVSELGSLRPTDITVLDMEASIEHLTRGTLRDVEMLLIVTEPYFRALETLGRTVPLARELGLKQIFIVANKVRTDRDVEAIQEYAKRLDVELLAVIPYDEDVQEADLRNRALIDYKPASPAATAITSIVDRLAAELTPMEAAAQG